jgi:hypothetical protein
MQGIQVDGDALIHHIANNYANNEGALNGKILISELIKDYFFYSHLKYVIKKILID